MASGSSRPGLSTCHRHRLSLSTVQSTYSRPTKCRLHIEITTDTLVSRFYFTRGIFYKRTDIETDNSICRKITIIIVNLNRTVSFDVFKLFSIAPKYVNRNIDMLTPSRRKTNLHSTSTFRLFLIVNN